MRLFWPLLIAFEIFLAAGIALQPFNAARGSYRHDERAAALKAMSEHPSPETKAAMQRELHLNAEHIVHQEFMFCGVLIVVFVLLDIACFYGWRNFRQNFGYKSPSA
jgi:hypothetical protein